MSKVHACSQNGLVIASPDCQPPLPPGLPSSLRGSDHWPFCPLSLPSEGPHHPGRRLALSQCTRPLPVTGHLGDDSGVTVPAGTQDTRFSNRGSTKAEAVGILVTAAHLSLCPGSPRACSGRACIEQRADHTPQVPSAWGCLKCIYLCKKHPHSGLFCGKPAQFICKTVRNKVFEKDAVKREAGHL